MIRAEAEIETPADTGLTAPPPPDTEEPSAPNGYRLLRRLGAGGMGEVWEAEELALKRAVALKFIRAETATAELRARLRAEAEAMARLDHPNVVRIHAVGEHAGRLFLSLESIAGGSLAVKLVAGPLPIHNAATTTEALARATAAAHAAGVVHRDIKPSNALLTLDGVPKLADFGLAKPFDSPGFTHSGQILGTPAYMAPEQALGLRVVGPLADVWSLGAVLYECLTGRPPFLAGSTLETLEQVRSAEPVPPRRLRPGVPRDLETICLKCLRKEPTGRYPSAAALADDLGRFLRGEPVRARPVPLIARLWRWMRREPGWALLGAALVLMIVAAVAGLALHNGRMAVALAAERVERERADGNFRDARSALNSATARARRIAIASATPQLRELLLGQLEDALAFYRAAHERNPDLESLTTVARAVLDLGLIESDAGQPQRAAELYAEADALLERLSTEQPDEPTHRANRARAIERRAEGQPPPEAERFLRQAVELFATLPTDAPLSKHWGQNAAKTRSDLGWVLGKSNRTSAAIAELERAASDLEHLRDEQNAIAWDMLAHVRMRLFNVFSAAKQTAEANEQERACLAVLTDARRHFPDSLELCLTEVKLRTNQAAFLGRANRPTEALAACDQALKIGEPALRREPSFVPLRTILGTTHKSRATALSALGRHSESADGFRKVRELHNPDPVSIGWSVAIELAQAGRHAEALVEADGYAHRVAKTDDWWGLAEVYALADRSERALECLQRAKDAAGKEWPTVAIEVGKDPLLERLRTRAAFRALVGP